MIFDVQVSRSQCAKAWGEQWGETCCFTIRAGCTWHDDLYWAFHHWCEMYYFWPLNSVRVISLYVMCNACFSIPEGSYLLLERQIICLHLFTLMMYIAWQVLIPINTLHACNQVHKVAPFRLPKSMEATSSLMREPMSPWAEEWCAWIIFLCAG